MILCICQGVSDRTVRLAVLNGAGSVDAIGDHCGAGTDCGSCRHAIEDIIDESGVVASPMRCDRYSDTDRSESERAA